jgi:hypothetical protein
VTAKTATTLDLTRSPVGTYQVRLLDLAGHTRSHYQSAGGQAYLLDVQALAAGADVAHVSGEATALITCLVKR